MIQVWGWSVRIFGWSIGIRVQLSSIHTRCVFWKCSTSRSAWAGGIGNPPLRQRAEGHGEMADPARAQQLGRQEGAAGQRCVDAQQPAGQAGRVVVEGLTRDQDHVGDTIGAAGADDELSAAPVVADEL